MDYSVLSEEDDGVFLEVDFKDTLSQVNTVTVTTDFHFSGGLQPFGMTDFSFSGRFRPFGMTDFSYSTGFGLLLKWMPQDFYITPLCLLKYGGDFCFLRSILSADSLHGN